MTEDEHMNDQAAELNEFERLRARLESLIDTVPGKAVEEARSLAVGGVIGGVRLAGLKAAILVDAGSCAGDKQAVAEGVELFRRLLQKHGECAELHYNIANGLVALADQEYPVAPN